VVVVAVASPLVVPDPPLEVLLLEAVWSLAPVEPAAPVVPFPVLAAPSVVPLAPTVVPPAVLALVFVAPPPPAFVLPPVVLLALELEGPLVASGCDGAACSEPHAATKNPNSIPTPADALFMGPQFECVRSKNSKTLGSTSAALPPWSVHVLCVEAVVDQAFLEQG